ncbi:MAG TPA: PKD domain-containing protein [Saprospiraceae bacterium]|nr:PKD domain-containing protein [Saprospiraceae bacterium]
MPPGAFYVTVTDANGCTGTERTSVGGNPVMIIKATPTAVTCDNAQGGSILVEFEVAGTAPYTIAWTGSGNPVAASLPFSISNLAAGNYCITVTDANGCTATTCTKVETALDIVLNSIPPANAACGGADVVVSISGTEQGTPDYTVSWSNADGSFSGNTVVSALPFTIANVPPGAFCVTVTDSKQCTGSECTTVTGDPVMLIQAVGTAVTCADSTAGSITVSFLVPGTAPYSLAWSGPVSGTQSGVSLPFTITGLLSGQYTVTVTDANGCTATAQATVETAIDVILTPTVASDPQCGGGNLIIDINPASATTPPHQYTWAGPFGLGGTVNPATFPDTLENLPLGQYSVTVTDAEGCTGVETAIITGQPKMVIQIDTAVAISCFGGGSDGMIVVSMPVPGIAPYTIQWTGGAPVPNAVFPFKINGLTPGSYTITVTDSKGCTATAEAKIETALDVTLQATPSTNLLCTGGNLIVNVVNGGTPPFDIKWSGPSNGEKLDVLLPDTLKNLPPGEYSVTVTDATGCTGTETATITGDTMFQIAALGTNLNCNGNGSDGSVTITLMQPTKEPYTLNLPGGVQIKNASFPYTLQNLGGGLVSITASDGNGCESSAEAMLTGGPADVSIEALSPLDTCQNQPILLSIKNLDLNDTLKTIKWTVSSPNVSVSPSDKAQTTVTATQAGTYTLTVVATNEHGCSATLTQVVTFDTIESLKGLIEADLCKGLPVQFSNLSGVPGTWNFGDNQTSTLSNPTHTYATPNTYHVTFTAQEKCVLPFDTSIVVKAGPAVTADFGFHVNDCFEKAVIQFSDSTVFTGSGKTWAWTFDPPAQSAGVQNPLITFTQSGTVTAQLIAVDANGCADTTKLEVPVEFVTDKIEELFPFCVGDSIPLNPQGAQTTFAYAWTSSPQDPTLDPTDPTPTVKPTQNTTYQLSITTPSGKCKVDYTAKAEQKPSVSGLDPADLTVCDEDPVTLTLGNTNGSTFVWSDSPSFSPVLGSSSSLTVVPQKDKTYYYKAENGTLCPLQGEVKVNLGKLDIEPTPLDQKVCFGEEALLGINNLDAGDTLQFVWTPTLDPVANPTVVPTQSGTYSVVVTNQFGCADTIQFKVAVIDLQVTAEIIGKDTICVGETAKLLATVSGNVQNPIISWTPAQSLTGANTLNPSAKPDVPTLYTVQVTTAEGLCPDTAEVDLFVVTGQCVEPFIFVPKAFTPNGDNNNDFFVVRGVNITEMLFIVWDRWGEEVYRTTDPSASGWDGTYNGRELTPDSYAWYLKARCGNGAEYIKKGDVTLLK